MNPFIYSDTNKRYHTFDYALKKKFGEKVSKISLNGGFSCPNLDGTKGVGGCIYCSKSGSGDFAPCPETPIREQYFGQLNNMRKKWDITKTIPYLQARTNTYADAVTLRRIYEECLALPGAVGLAIATRPDCLSEETVDLLEEISEKTYLVVELGLQSAHDETLRLINRGHTYAGFLQGYNKLKSRNINICVHIINGLPGESESMMTDTVKRVGELEPHALKIHLLHVIKDTPLAKMYEEKPFFVFSREEYVNLICNQLELLSPEIIIERLTGDGKKEDLIAPLWSLKKFCVLNEIDKELVRRNSYQGKKL